MTTREIRDGRSGYGADLLSRDSSVPLHTHLVPHPSPGSIFSNPSLLSVYLSGYRVMVAQLLYDALSMSAAWDLKGNGRVLIQVLDQHRVSEENHERRRSGRCPAEIRN
jgi:hypothetical protein